MRMRVLSKTGHKAICLNRRKAIRERCLNCSGWQYKSVAKCEFTDCTLYPFRSGQGKQNAKNRSKAIRDYCLWCMGTSKSEVAKCCSFDCSLFPYRKFTVDRSAEIKYISKLGHIELVSGNKKRNQYQSADITLIVRGRCPQLHERYLRMSRPFLFEEI